MGSEIKMNVKSVVDVDQIINVFSSHSIELIELDKLEASNDKISFASVGNFEKQMYLLKNL